MEIWFNKPDLDRLNHPPIQHMGTWLEITFTQVEDEALYAKMPVNEKTRQPMGILHGGASVVLAETIGSVASYFVIKPATHVAVGMEINANHLRPVRAGFVHAVCRPIHLGKSSHVWDIRLTDDQDKAICISRLTVAIVEKGKIS
jgi:1,4-dihydroxy-2-naphthoyl-CoA hydrolase